MVAFQRISNLVFIFVLFLVLIGGYIYQYGKGLHPCPLCILQRLGMIGVASSLLMNCRFGIKVQHYGLALISALIGRLFSLRQIAMHICPEFPPYGETVLGFELYVWAYFVFSCSILALAILIILYGFTKHKEFLPVWGIGEKIAFLAMILITASNLFTTFLECGLTDC